MKKARKISCLLFAALTFSISVTPVIHAASSSDGVIERFWGDTDNAKNSAERAFIYARRVLMAAVTVATFGGLLYMLKQALSKSSGFLLPRRRPTTNHPQFGLVFTDMNAAQNAMPNCEIVQLKGTGQGYNQCLFFARGNIGAIDQLGVDQLNSNAVGQACRQNVDRYLQVATALRAQNAVIAQAGNEMEQGDLMIVEAQLGNSQRDYIFIGQTDQVTDNQGRANPIMGIAGLSGSLLGQGNHAQDANNHDASEEAFQEFRNGQREKLHFILNFGNGHWQALSVIRRDNGQSPLAVFVDSIDWQPDPRQLAFIDGLVAPQAPAPA